jgi:hypothetical protein
MSRGEKKPVGFYEKDHGQGDLSLGSHGVGVTVWIALVAYLRQIATECRLQASALRHLTGQRCVYHWTTSFLVYIYSRKFFISCQSKIRERKMHQPVDTCRGVCYFNLVYSHGVSPVFHFIQGRPTHSRWLKKRIQ